MTIGKLKKAISHLPDSMRLVIQKDREGNGYSPLEGIDADCVYIADNTWSGEVYDLEFDPENCCFTVEEWHEILQVHPQVCVLYPVN